MDTIAKVVATALGPLMIRRSKRQKQMQKQIFDLVSDERYTPLNQLFLSTGKLYSRVYQRYVRLKYTTSN